MLEVKNLKVSFKVGNKTVVAVNDISFTIPPKSIVGLVGESGSGKSVSSLAITQLLPDNACIEAGEILWQDENLLNKSKKELRAIRGKDIALIFQNPQAALNPVFTIGNQMIETILLHHDISKEEARLKAINLLKKVSIPDAETRLNDYPHHFSMGMCQRVMIAMTAAMEPQLLIADEPTASLDVTIQAQVLNLIEDLRDEFGMSILLISHDLGVIAQHCDEVLIMYLGHLVEKGSPEAIFCTPKHPYTKALISAIPNPDPRIKKAPTLLQGEIPSPMNLPKGCVFHPRCPECFAPCDQKRPELKTVEGREVGCFLYED